MVGRLVVAWLMTPLSGFELLNVGAPRTGTQTIAAALRQLGMKVLHTGYNETVRQPLCFHVLHQASDEEAKAVYDEYDAAMDEPTQLEYEFVMKAYPKAKFLLPVADADRWADSYHRFFEATHFTPARAVADVAARGLKVKRQDVLQVLGAISDASTQGSPIANYCGACHYWGCHFDRMSGMSEEELSTCKNGMEAHMARVKRVIPPDRLLVYNISDGWAPLCNFLGRPIPKEPFPYVDVYKTIFDIEHGTGNQLLQRAVARQAADPEL